MAWRKWIYVLPLRLRSLFLRRRVEQDLQDELAFHLEMEASRHTRTGLDASEAERRARRAFGGVASIKDACRDALRMHWIDTVARDVRYALRSFRHSPVFTLVALSSLAIGVGANCAAFSWADALLLRPLTVPRPSEVLTVGSSTPVQGALANILRASYPEYVAMRDRTTTFDGLLAFNSYGGGFAVSRDAMPKLKIGMFVSGNFTTVLGLQPALGRSFRPEEDQMPGRDAVMVISHRLWRQEFNGDPSVLGRQIVLTGIPLTVIGVAPEGFLGLEQFVQSDFYVPLMMLPRFGTDPKVNPLEARDARYLSVRGRLKPGATLDAAAAELSILAADLARAYPATNRNHDFIVRTELQFRTAQMPPITMLILLLTTLAAAVLAVACANVAGLLTSRAPARAREIAVRSAIGAGRAGLIRQLMTEHLLLAAGGGLLGLAVGFASIKLFQQIRIPTDMPIGFTFDLDRRALGVGTIVAAGSALLFGLAPAIQTSRVDLSTIMKGTEVAAGGSRRWGRSVLVGGQVAISVVVLVIATFSYRAFHHQLAQGPGYRLDHLLMLSFDPGLIRKTPAESRRFYEQLLDRVRSAPGVRAAALTAAVPMQTIRLNLSTIVPDAYRLPQGTDNVSVMSAQIDEQYLATIGIPIVNGRGFRREDTEQSARVAVVNELVAQHYWPGLNPIGKRFQLIHEGAAPSVVEVVGVAKTSKYILLPEPPTEYLYLPYRQEPQSAMILLVESAGDPALLAAPIRDIVRTLDSGQLVFDVQTMEEFFQLSTVGLMNTIIGMVAAMGTMGLALSIVGLYGLVAYAASRRTREIGIRMALGADRAAVLRMVLRSGVALAVAGLALGLVASIGAGELLERAFPGGSNEQDFTALWLVGAAVLVVTALAAYIPARRASRVNPMDALRYE